MKAIFFFRELIPRAEVLDARKEILLKYAIVGEIDPNQPLIDAIFSNNSAIDKVNLRAFAESVRTGQAYLNVVLNQKVMDFWGRFMDSDVHCYDMRWPRFVRPKEGCGFHYDGPYMNRGTSKLFTSWIPLGDVSQEEGALIVLENSHKADDLIYSIPMPKKMQIKISLSGLAPIRLSYKTALVDAGLAPTSRLATFSALPCIHYMARSTTIRRLANVGSRRTRDISQLVSRWMNAGMAIILRRMAVKWSFFQGLGIGTMRTFRST